MLWKRPFLSLVLDGGSTVSIGIPGSTVDVSSRMNKGNRLSLDLEFHEHELVSVTHVDAVNAANPYVQVRTCDSEGNVLVDLPAIEVAG